MRPCPDLRVANVGVWRLFQLTYGGINYRGMDGEPAGRHLCDVESAARALRIPWTETTLVKFSLIEQVWQQDVATRIEAKRKETEMIGKPHGR